MLVDNELFLFFFLRLLYIKHVNKSAYMKMRLERDNIDRENSTRVTPEVIKSHGK